MKKILFVALVFFMGCSSKNIVKKPSVDLDVQKQDAQKAWKSLDKE